MKINTELLEELTNEEDAITYIESLRWKDGVVCPYCNSNKTCKKNDFKRSRWQCWKCHKSFSVTVGTLFHRTHVDLLIWLKLIALMLNDKKGISTSQAACVLDIRQKTVWSMMKRIREAIDNGQMDLLDGFIINE